MVEADALSPKADKLGDEPELGSGNACWGLPMGAALTADGVEITSASSKPSGLKGETVLPGDKSISHRAVLMGALAEGVTRVENLLEGEDVLCSAAAMRHLGADIECDIDKQGKKVWSVTGISNQPQNADQGKSAAIANLYFGNAGTGVRLALGLVAGLGRQARFDGDGSLRGRPMGRILAPLRQMGAKAKSEESANADERLPIVLEKSVSLQAIRYRLPVPSAQIKSAILLAGLGASGTTIIEEPICSRDHTENMFRSFGIDIDIEPFETDGKLIRVKGGQTLTATHIIVPGDPSSAAFPMAAALIVPGSDVTLKNVLMNPMRIGVITTFQEMGADIEILSSRQEGGEPVADLRVRYRPLKGVTVPAARAPAMIDEYPILAIVAAFAKGTTRMNGIGEMRIKESDRIAATQAGSGAKGWFNGCNTSRS